MFFALWFLIWVIVANTLLAFLLPGASLFVRAAYTNRSLSLLRWQVIVVALLMFLGYLLLEEYTPTESAVHSIRVLVIAALMIHLLGGMLTINVNRWPSIGFALHYASRVWSIIKVRQTDRLHAFKQVWSSANWRNRPGLLAQMATNTFVEMVILIKQVTLIVRARGGIPPTTAWCQPGHRRYLLGKIPYVLVGDIILLLILLAITFPNQDYLAPDIFRTAAHWFDSAP